MDSNSNDDSKDLRCLYQVPPQEADFPEQGKSLQIEEPIPAIAQNRQFDFEYTSSGERNLLTISFTEFYLSIHGTWKKSFNYLSNFDSFDDFEMSYFQGNLLN